MIYRSAFRVAATIEQVARFHRRAASLRAITPPLMPMTGVVAPDPLEPGCEMSFTVWMGPVPVFWRAGLEALPEGVGFIDRQLAGPFASWVHEHRFEDDGAGGAWIHDRIEARLRRHPLWGALGLAMWLGLPALFLYRRWRTRRCLLEGGDP